MPQKIIRLGNPLETAKRQEEFRIFKLRARFVLERLGAKENPNPSFLASLNQSPEKKLILESPFFGEWLEVQLTTLEKVCEQENLLQLIKFLVEIIYIDLIQKWALPKSSFTILDIQSLCFDIYFNNPEVKEEALAIINRCEELLGNQS